MIRRPPRSTLFPTRRSSDLDRHVHEIHGRVGRLAGQPVEQRGDPRRVARGARGAEPRDLDRKSTRLNSSHVRISYAVFCLKKKKKVKCTSNRYGQRG